MIIPVNLPNFPDWAVPMAKIIPVLRVPDGFDPTLLTINSLFSYTWKKLDNDHYELSLDITATAAQLDETPVPIYCDLDIVLINENNYYTIQTEGQ